MRVLCDQTYCPICRGELPQIVHLTKKQMYDSVERRSCIPNRKCKILFEDESVEEAFEALLEHRCLVCDTRPIFDNFRRLQSHMSRTHVLFACDLCVSHLKIFPFERKFYTRSELATHRRSGDPDNRSYRGHPSCRFCDDRYMDNDELLRHLRKVHYYCHFCDSSSSNNEYFADYPDLRVHFQTVHLLCEEGPCGHPETRFTNAFATEIDYKAHVAAEHMGNKSKAQARELRTIEMGFQMAPRRRGRDAGVIAPEDFEEVNDANRGQRDRRQRRYNNQHESSSRRDNATPPPAAEASGPPAPQPPTLDDFPTLGNGPLQYVPTAPKPAEQVEDFPSLSSNAQSRPAAITTSSLVSTSPRPGKTSKSAATQKQPNAFSTLASIVTSSGPGHLAGARGHPAEAEHPSQATTITKQSWGAPRISSGEDFPSLGSNKKGRSVKDGSSHVPLGAWTKKQTANSYKPPANKSDRDSPSVRSVSSLASLGRSLCDDGEFPTLGGSAPAKQATWVQKNTKPAKNKTEKSAFGNCLVMPVPKKGHERVAQVNGASECRTSETKSEKKKKKQKEKETKASTEDSGISLSSIASEIDAVAVIPKETSTVKRHSSESSSSGQDFPSNDQAASSVSVRNNEPGESGKPDGSSGEPDESSGVPDGSGEWKTVNSKKSAAFCEDDFPSLSGLCRKGNGKVSSAKEFPSEDSKTKKNKPPAKTTSWSFQADLLSILNGSEKTSDTSSVESAGDKKSKKKTDWSKKSKPLLGDDFPELPAQTKKTKPPPGFQKADIAAPPPGLGARPSSLGRRAPPGLNSMPSASASSSQLATSIPMSVKLSFYPYVLPQDQKQRNSALVSRVRQLLILKDDGFASFCALSKDFRAGQLNAQEYHKTCQDLFGQEKFLEVLPELVALLPDILKQHELAVAHTQSAVGKGAPLDLVTCPTCLQYLRVEDSVEHSSSHVNLGQACL